MPAGASSQQRLRSLSAYQILPNGAISIKYKKYFLLITLQEKFKNLAVFPRRQLINTTLVHVTEMKKIKKEKSASLTLLRTMVYLNNHKLESTLKNIGLDYFFCYFYVYEAYFFIILELAISSKYHLVMKKGSEKVVTIHFCHNIINMACLSLKE